MVHSIQSDFPRGGVADVMPGTDEDIRGYTERSGVAALVPKGAAWALRI
jgi:hypothetical protein